jgi:hypothetical protein
MSSMTFIKELCNYLKKGMTLQYRRKETANHHFDTLEAPVYFKNTKDYSDRAYKRDRAEGTLT